MNTALTVSAETGLTIPPEMCKAVRIPPGTRVEIIAFGGQVHLVPVRPIEELFGALPGLDTDVEREREDREI